MPHPAAATPALTRTGTGLTSVPGMEAVFERVETVPEVSWTCHLRREERFGFHWHFHPEHELTLITAGTGHRFVGDSIEPYGPGDLVLAGPDLPHTYASDSGPAEAVVAQFRPDFLGPALFAGPDLAPIGRLLAAAAGGLAFPAARAAEVGATLRGLLDRPGPERTLDLLAVLLALARAGDARPLAGPGYRPALDRTTRDRLDAVCRHLQDRYREPVRLAEVARVAHLSPAACCRFFRRATGRTLTAYLTELRIAAACRLLADTDRPVTDIATSCGYPNLANFNRRFRQLKATTPRSYRAAHRTG